MLKAIDYVILRQVKASGLLKVPLDRKPVMVCTLINEDEFCLDQRLVHLRTVLFEDQMHDWAWREGQLRYFSRSVEVADIVVVYACEEVAPPCNFDPMTGAPLVKACP